MVNIENITEREEKRKLHIKRTKDLLNKFFNNISILDTSTSISVTENGQSFSFLYFDPSSNKMTLSIPESDIPQYTDKTLAFIKEYEKKFNVEVTLRTDYSKLS